MKIITQLLSTPAGRRILGDCGGKLCLSDWYGAKSEAELRRRLNSDFEEGDTEVLQAAGREIQLYFKGELREFTVPLTLNGTPSQIEVWNKISAVPYGSVISYRQLAEMCGTPAAIRAVARAAGANLLPLFIPCHRIICSDGSPGGYSGGLDAKMRLLALEKGEKTLF